MTTEHSVAGIWYNQHSSVLTLAADSAGNLTGHLRSHSGLAKTFEPCAVTGFVRGELVAFVVDFGRFDSLTTWAGHLVSYNDEDSIRACWHMTVTLPMKDTGEETWRGIWTGEDEFRRTPPSARVPAGRLTSEPYGHWR